MSTSASGSRWLYVGAFVPLEGARHAGGRVAFENLELLRHRYADVDVVVCTTEPETAAPAPAGMTVLRHRPGDFAGYLLGHASSLGLRRLATAPILHTRLGLSAQRTIEALMRDHAYDGIFADFTQSLLLVQRSAASAGCAAPITVCIHDVFAQRLLRSRSHFERLLTGTVMRDEQALLAGAQTVMALSEKDAQLARTLYALPDVRVKPFSPPSWCRNVRRVREGIDRSALLFFANFERPENRDAAVWFVDQALPQVRRATSDATLVLAGNGSDVLAATLNREAVTGTGFLEDPAAHFSRCALAIAPLMQGAGVKFKVLEALAAGVPVVGTPIALEGIEPQPDLVMANVDRFAQVVIEQLRQRGGDR